jgi:hypothetical protein
LCAREGLGDSLIRELGRRKRHGDLARPWLKAGRGRGGEGMRDHELTGRWRGRRASRGGRISTTALLLEASTRPGDVDLEGSLGRRHKSGEVSKMSGDFSAASLGVRLKHVVDDVHPLSAIGARRPASSLALMIHRLRDLGRPVVNQGHSYAEGQ